MKFLTCCRIFDFNFYSDLVDAKFTIATCDSPVGYVCGVYHKTIVELPEEAEDICSSLLPILAAVFKCRMMMESTNKLVGKNSVDIEDPTPLKSILPSFKK